MDWTDGYMQASFRGKKFYVESVKSSGGRRLVTHLFPGKDDEYHEDNGRQNKRFSVSAYITSKLEDKPRKKGVTYINARGDLIDALEQEGPGILIHPYWGEYEVRVVDWNCNENINQGRTARIDITFVWETTVAFMVMGDSALDNLNAKKQSFLDAAIDFFEDVYDVATSPQAYVQDAIDVGTKAIDVIEAAKNVSGVISEYNLMIDTLKGQLSAAVLTAQAIGLDMLEIVDFGTDVTDVNLVTYTYDDQAKEQYSELSAVTSFQDLSVSSYPSLASEDAYPARELQKHISRCAMASKAGLIGTMTLSNVREADEVRKDLDALIRTVEEDETISSDFYEAAQDLRVAVEKMIAERKLELSELKTITLSEFEPAIVLAHELYQDIDRTEQIADLNDVLHPGFMPSGDLVVNVD